VSFGERTLLVEFRLQKGAVLPKHKHGHEQTGYLVSGRMDLTIGNETRRQEPCEPCPTRESPTWNLSSAKIILNRSGQRSEEMARAKSAISSCPAAGRL
jgi:hypothetical protein